jgi:hypothetical protein
VTTFVTSKGTRAQHVSPKYQSRPYRQHPGRREFIHGRIRPMQVERDWSAPFFSISGVVIFGYFVARVWL